MQQKSATLQPWRTALIAMLAGRKQAHAAAWRSMPTQEKTGALRKALRWYVGFWLAAVVLSGLQYHIHTKHLGPSELTPHEEIWDAYTTRSLSSSASHAVCYEQDIACNIAWVIDQLHEKQTAPTAVFKSIVVIVLACLWFTTFTFVGKHVDWAEANEKDFRRLSFGRRRWWYDSKRVKHVVVTLAVLPALFLVLAMAGEYEPAVFVMALAAIYVAAEHYSSLEKTKEDIKSQVEQLELHVGQILNADGMNAWREQLYEAYRVAKRRIDAVVRYFDIDREWWECYQAPDPWEEYKQRANADARKSLLLGVLTDPTCRAKIQYVVDLPMPQPDDAVDPAIAPGAAATQSRSAPPAHLKPVFPIIPGTLPVPASPAAQAAAAATPASPPSTAGSSPCHDVNPAPAAKYFRDLMGLAWQLAIMHEVGKHRGDPKVRHPAKFCYARIKISGAPSWMHVVDERTFQVIDRQDASIATVRELNRDIYGETSRVRLSDWARRNVRAFADRGTLADEHLLSTLRRAALQYDGNEGAHLDMHRLGPVLRLMGMDAYLSDAAHRDFVMADPSSFMGDSGPVFLPSRDVGRHMCIAIFDAYLRQKFNRNNAILVCDLAEELL
jgi:hypothetical protein